ncbi:MAG TPA: aminotransferase class I/II-fold pyridoxal phosphate-dependent enzyme [Kofleriaceae bacterium]
MKKPLWDHALATRAVHAGHSPDASAHASAPTLVMSNSFVVAADTSFSAESSAADAPHLYTRWSNPTVAELEDSLASLEGGEAAACFATGMAAFSGLLLHLLKAGDRLVMSDVAYAGAVELAHGKLAQLGIEVATVDMSDLDAVARAITPRTRLVHAETPCNPILRLTDIRAVADLAHRHGALLAVDSTFATPVATRPLALGADFVLHSLSKYLGGHGDALGGAIIGTRRAITDLRRDAVIHLGGALSPFNAWLIARGIATLPLRMRAHSDNALSIASRLEHRRGIKRVIYPGLPSHPQHELARRQMQCSSGMFTFQVEDGPRVARRLAESLGIFHYAVSLGHHRSLVFYLDTAQLMESSFHLSGPQLDSYRRFAGEGIFRVSVGIEDADDLYRDLDQALG